MQQIPALADFPLIGGETSSQIYTYTKYHSWDSHLTCTKFNLTRDLIDPETLTVQC